jgi:hypothetical protein
MGGGGGGGFGPEFTIVLLLTALLLTDGGVGTGVGLLLGEGYALIVALLLDAGSSFLTHPL